MNIAVCVKQVVDTEAEFKLDPASWRLDRSVTCVLNPYDEYAVEEALRIKEAHGGEVTAVCMGPETATDAVRKALAMGADKAVLVSDAALAGSDVQGTAYALAEALKTLEWDLVVFGVRSTDGETGCVPAAVAERLGVPLLSGSGQGGGRRRQAHGEPGDRDGLRAVRMPDAGRALGDQGHQRAALPFDEGHHDRQDQARGHQGRRCAVAGRRPDRLGRGQDPGALRPHSRTAQGGGEDRGRRHRSRQDRRLPLEQEARLVKETDQ